MSDYWGCGFTYVDGLYGRLYGEHLPEKFETEGPEDLLIRAWVAGYRAGKNRW